MRCRYSRLGKEWLGKPDREGEFLGYTRRGSAKVRWPGNKTISQYHRDFIEVFAGPEDADTLADRTSPADDMRAGLYGTR